MRTKTLQGGIAHVTIHESGFRLIWVFVWRARAISCHLRNVDKNCFISILMITKYIYKLIFLISQGRLSWTLKKKKIKVLNRELIRDTEPVSVYRIVRLLRINVSHSVDGTNFGIPNDYPLEVKSSR